MKKITITNEFHNTIARVYVDEDGYLTPSQVRRLQNKLCGIDGCTCGDRIGARPSMADAMPDGGAILK